MMTKDEALKLALAVLKEWRKGFPDDWTDFDTEAVTAIKEALAQPEQEHVIECPRCGHCCPQRPEQEPVAWRNAALRVGEDLCSVGPFGYYDMTAKQWLDWALSVVTVHAPPPHRKPLTDVTIWNTYKNLWMFHPAEEPRLAGDVLKFARAIEAAHGIKGDA